MTIDAAALLQSVTSVSDMSKTIIGGLVPALVIYGVTKRDITKAKEFSVTAREEARKELAESLAPALNGFKLELLKDMNGTYLRTKEALVHFNAIQHSLERLENASDSRVNWEQR